MRTVTFLRDLAKQAGGLDTVRGQALHRAAAHFVKLQEQLTRAEEALRSDLTYERRQHIAAEGIYMTMRARTIEASPDAPSTPPEWSAVPAFARTGWLLIADAALGAPMYESPVEEEQTS